MSLEKQTEEEIFTIEKAIEKFGLKPNEQMSGENFQAYWELENEVIKILFKEAEGNGFSLRVLTIHSDALANGSWDDNSLDWHYINEIYFTSEELEKIQKLMEEK